ncbi:MAG: HipA domain-containing protein [Marinifilaceae bacterium]
MNKKCLYCYKEISEENNFSNFHYKCSKEFFGEKEPPSIEYTLNKMEELAKEVVARSIAVTGVQPKLSMSVFSENKENRLTIVGALGGKYIFKPPNKEFREMPANEHITMRLAEKYGISTVPSSLIKLKSGELSYITKRIDRNGSDQKIHMLDMFQILEAFDKYKGSMEKIGKALSSFSSHRGLDKIRLFEITLFSFLTGNNDMHLKNFSMINFNDSWQLSPAYDLLNVAIINPKDKEELALTLEGKKKNFNKAHFIKFGENLGLGEKQIKSTFKKFSKNKAKAIEMIRNSFLSKELQKEYTSLLEERYSRIE